MAWFREAGFGLFLHFGLYSLLGRGEWAMFKERIPVSEYAELKADFRAERFDAESIADLALEAGMSYVNITARHHDSFCLFETEQTDFNSVDAPCGRDLMGEVARACRERRLGLFLYYSYALDWRHPYFMSREVCCDVARPHYPSPDPTYLYREEGDFRHYLDFVHSQLRELLTSYGPLAGIWLDPIMPYYNRPDMFPIDETYSLIRSLQPQALICFKQGANGNEDFTSCERRAGSLAHKLSGMPAEVARGAWEANMAKQREICDTMQPGSWGYDESGKHRGPGQIREMLDHAAGENGNLLLNVGPMGDGSIPAEDRTTLRLLGDKR
jgi:alpha-L-fucosidase